MPTPLGPSSPKRRWRRDTARRSLRVPRKARNGPHRSSLGGLSRREVRPKEVIRRRVVPREGDCFRSEPDDRHEPLCEGESVISAGLPQRQRTEQRPAALTGLPREIPVRLGSPVFCAVFVQGKDTPGSTWQRGAAMSGEPGRSTRPTPPFSHPHKGQRNPQGVFIPLGKSTAVKKTASADAAFGPVGQWKPGNPLGEPHGKFVGSCAAMSKHGPDEGERMPFVLRNRVPRSHFSLPEPRSQGEGLGSGESHGQRSGRPGPGQPGIAADFE